MWIELTFVFQKNMGQRNWIEEGIKLIGFPYKSGYLT